MCLPSISLSLSLFLSLAFRLQHCAYRRGHNCPLSSPRGSCLPIKGERERGKERREGRRRKKIADCEESCRRDTRAISSGQRERACVSLKSRRGEGEGGRAERERKEKGGGRKEKTSERENALSGRFRRRQVAALEVPLLFHFPTFLSLNQCSAHPTLLLFKDESSCSNKNEIGADRSCIICIIFQPQS